LLIVRATAAAQYAPGLGAAVRSGDRIAGAEAENAGHAGGRMGFEAAIAAAVAS
jgi:hypothetical protein